MRKFGFHHAQAARYSVAQLRRHPWSNGFTVAVIGIALALPLILSVVLSNIQQMTQGWDMGNHITIFLKDSTTSEQANKLVDTFRQQSSIERVDYLSREDSLKEFTEDSGFSDALKLLPENPLPAVIILHPHLQNMSNEETAQWVAQLRALPTVELVQLDQNWLQRLHAFMQVGERGVWILSVLLLVAVALVIGNTIRLLIHNRQEEIVLINIIGGTPGFIRRPFLYMGVWFGLGGGLLACILVTISLLSLQSPVSVLANLYDSSFMLSSISFQQILNVLLLSTLAGWVSAFIVVTHYLQRLNVRPA